MDVLVTTLILQDVHYLLENDIVFVGDILYGLPLHEVTLPDIVKDIESFFVTESPHIISLEMALFLAQCPVCKRHVVEPCSDSWVYNIGGMQQYGLCLYVKRYRYEAKVAIVHSIPTQQVRILREEQCYR